MRDEILQKAYPTDTATIPRYRILNQRGDVILDGIEIQLLNTILQAGTPFDKEHVLPDDVATSLCPGVDDPALADVLRRLAPAYTYGTEDIEAGSASTAPNGTLHFIYEPA